MNVLHCRRGVGCDGDGVIGAHSEEEGLLLAAEQAQTQHGVQVTPQGTAQVRSHIHDEDTYQASSPTLLPPGTRARESEPAVFLLQTL